MKLWKKQGLQVLLGQKEWQVFTYLTDARVLSAVRGPDIHIPRVTSPLKELVTARVRAILEGDRDDVFVLQRGIITRLRFNEGDLALLFKAVKAMTDGDYRKLYHFLQHLREAVEVTATHPIWGGYADEIAFLLMWPHAAMACNSLEDARNVYNAWRAE